MLTNKPRRLVKQHTSKWVKNERSPLH